MIRDVTLVGGFGVLDDLEDVVELPSNYFPGFQLLRIISHCNFNQPLTPLDI